MNPWGINWSGEAQARCWYHTALSFVVCARSSGVQWQPSLGSCAQLCQRVSAGECSWPSSPERSWCGACVSCTERELGGGRGDSDTGQGGDGMDYAQDARLVCPEVAFPFSSHSVAWCSLAEPAG